MEREEMRIHWFEPCKQTELIAAGKEIMERCEKYEFLANELGNKVQRIEKINAELTTQNAILTASAETLQAIVDSQVNDLKIRDRFITDLEACSRCDAAEICTLIDRLKAKEEQCDQLVVQMKKLIANQHCEAECPKNGTVMVVMNPSMPDTPPKTLGEQIKDKKGKQ